VTKVGAEGRRENSANLPVAESLDGAERLVAGVPPDSASRSFAREDRKIGVLWIFPESWRSNFTAAGIELGPGALAKRLSRTDRAWEGGARRL